MKTISLDLLSCGGENKKIENLLHKMQPDNLVDFFHDKQQKLTDKKRGRDFQPRWRNR